MEIKNKRTMIIVGIIILFIATNIPYKTIEPYKDVEIYTVSEPYTITETYSENEPYETIENVDIPYQETFQTQWNVTWYPITGAGQWGSSVGMSIFPSTFTYNWGQGVVFEEYADYIGFVATSTINVPQDRPVSFTIGGDDGIQLYIDGQLTIDDYDLHPYRTQSKVINLNAGKHSLILHYYEWTDSAMVSFDTDKDILTWQEQKTRTEQQKVVKYHDVSKERTVTKYHDIQKSRDIIKLKEVDLSIVQRVLNRE